MIYENMMSILFQSIEIVKKYGTDVSELFPYNDKFANYKHILTNYLTLGKNCGDCCYIELGDQIRDQYQNKLKEMYK